MLMIKVFLWWPKLIFRTFQYQNTLFLSTEMAGKALLSFVGIHCEIFFHVSIGAIQADDRNVVPYCKEIQLDSI